MNYEQKYKEALEWMRSIYPTMQGVDKEDAKHYFPELSESEDEKIRKALLKHFSQMPEHGYLTGSDVTFNDAISWLEKQGEQKEIDYDEELKKCKDNPLYFYNKYVKIKLKEQNPAWSEEDEIEFNHILKILTSVAKEQEIKGYNNLISSINWFKSIKDRVQLQSHWKPNDAQLSSLGRFIEGVYGCIDFTNIKSLYNDLKLL